MTVYATTRRAVQEHATHVWAALHPRNYDGAPGWCDPAVPAASIGGVVAADADGYSDGPGKVTILTAALLARHAVPTYHVGRELLHAVSRTEPPELRWPDMAWPHDAGIFLLPCGSVRDSAGLAYDWVSWARVRANEPIRLLTPSGKQFAARSVALTDDTLIFCTAATSSPTFAALNLALAASDLPSTALPTTLPDAYRDGDSLVGDEPDILRLLASYAIGLILTMHVRPELREAGQRVRRIKDGPARERWTPNWLGRTYRVERACAAGTHGSPRLHWRRGHWRQQPYGPGRSQVRTIWIEPMLVG